MSEEQKQPKSLDEVMAECARLGADRGKTLPKFAPAQPHPPTEQPPTANEALTVATPRHHSVAMVNCLRCGNLVPKAPVEGAELHVQTNLAHLTTQLCAQCSKDYDEEELKVLLVFFADGAHKGAEAQAQHDQAMVKVLETAGDRLCERLQAAEKEVRMLQAAENRVVEFARSEIEKARGLAKETETQWSACAAGWKFVAALGWTAALFALLVAFSG